MGRKKWIESQSKLVKKLIAFYRETNRQTDVILYGKDLKICQHVAAGRQIPIFEESIQELERSFERLTSESQ